MEGTFDHKDHYLDSNIRTLNGDLIFSITSDHSTWKGYKTTWLRGNKGGQPLGIIQWETRAFEIHGRLLPWDNLKASGGHSTRLWRWSTTQYQLEYKDHEWKAVVPGTTSLAARFRPFHPHTFHKDEPSVMQIFPHASEDLIFLVLVFLYSEMKRLDSQSSDNSDAIDAATSVS